MENVSLRTGVDSMLYLAKNGGNFWESNNPPVISSQFPRTRAFPIIDLSQTCGVLGVSSKQLTKSMVYNSQATQSIEQRVFINCSVEGLMSVKSQSHAKAKLTSICLAWVTMSSSISLPSEQSPLGQVLGQCGTLSPASSEDSSCTFVWYSATWPTQDNCPNRNTLKSETKDDSVTRHPWCQVGVCSFLGPLSDDRHPNHWCWVLDLRPALRRDYQHWRFARPFDRHWKEDVPSEDNSLLSQRTRGLWRFVCGVFKKQYNTQLYVFYCHSKNPWILYQCVKKVSTQKNTSTQWIQTSTYHLLNDRFKLKPSLSYSLSFPDNNLLFPLLTSLWIFFGMFGYIYCLDSVMWQV